MNLSEEKYRLVVESTYDAIVIVQDGVLKYANPSAVNLSGYSLKTLERMPFVELIHPDDRALVVEHHQKRLRGESAPSHYTFRIIDREGATRWVENRGILFEWEGQPASLSVLRDITRTRLLEEQLIQAQRLQAVGTLADGIAHDFDNMLHAISGLTQLLLLDKQPDDPETRRLREIEHSARKAGDLVRQILTFSRRIESNLIPTRLNDEIDHAVGILERTLPEKICMELELAENLESINADQEQIEQVLMNLAINAGHAMPDGGKLTFKTKSVLLDQDFCEANLGARPGAYVCVSISDTGCGMDRDTLNQIFEPFFTTRQPDEGIGMGLAMVYGIIKNHGGYIKCDSEPGQGTVFEIFIPIIQNKADDPSVTADNKAALPCGNESILLVDDDPTVRAIGREMLEMFGYTVITADCGEIAITTLNGHIGHIDLVILDVNMPGMGGVNCLKHMLEENPAMRVIMASGFSPDGSVRKSLREGACGFIGKPYRIPEMLRKVREVLDI